MNVALDRPVSVPPVAAREVAQRLEALWRRIEAAGGDRSVRVVAVTKGFGPDAVAAAIAAGITDLGENYADELLAKREATAGIATEPAAGARRTARAGPAADGAAPTAAAPLTGEPRWHFLGHVQRNKVRRLAAVVSLWQGVDRLAAGREIAHRAPGARVLVQVNVSGEAARNGCSPAEAPALVDGLLSLGLDVAGLMAVGPTGAPELARPGFRAIARLADAMGLGERSMGMTDDLEVAVQEGTTMVRVGRALFGPRPGRLDLRR